MGQCDGGRDTIYPAVSRLLVLCTYTFHVETVKASLCGKLAGAKKREVRL